jgi:PIN domain nuclease of toxin-antitoxin system
VNVLLDTNALIWASLSRNSLSRAAATAIADETNTIYVSAASAWEIATKVRIGKLAVAAALENRFVQAMEEAGYTLLAINTEDALRAARFPAAHRDPFDRIIAAQALALDIPVISKDPQLDQFNIRRIW